MKLEQFIADVTRLSIPLDFEILIQDGDGYFKAQGFSWSDGKVYLDHCETQEEKEKLEGRKP